MCTKIENLIDGAQGGTVVLGQGVQQVADQNAGVLGRMWGGVKYVASAIFQCDRAP